MVGRAWRQLFVDRNVPFECAQRPDFELTQPESYPRLDRFRAVVNCAAWTDVDGAEANESEATLANADAVGWLAEQCARDGIVLVHYSTDFVFPGTATKPYAVDAAHGPVNAYGRGKAVGERRLWASGCPHLLIRTSWVYAPWGKNFVRTIARLARERSELAVVNDQRGRPTSAEQLASLSWALLEHGARGTFHATDSGECTWFDFASQIAARLNPDCEVSPCSSDAFPRPASRPAYSVLGLERTEDLIGNPEPWEAELDRVLERIELD